MRITGSTNPFRLGGILPSAGVAVKLFITTIAEPSPSFRGRQSRVSKRGEAPLFNIFPLSVTAWKWLKTRELTRLQRFAAIRNLLSRLGGGLDTLRRPVGMIEVCLRVNARSVELTGLVGRYAFPGIRPVPSAGRHLRLRRVAAGYLPVTHLLLRKDTLSIYPLMSLLPPIRRRRVMGKARDTFLRVVCYLAITASFLKIVTIFHKSRNSSCNMHLELVRGRVE